MTALASPTCTNLTVNWMTGAPPSHLPVPCPTSMAHASRRSAPRLRIYPGIDHFDIYDGPSHEAVVADEVEFLPATY